MSVLRRVKLRTPDGIESIEYPLGVEAENVEVANGENLSQRLARIDEDLENNEEDIAAVGELAGTNKQNIGANEIRIDALEKRSTSVDKKPYYFNTVADMKAYQGLKEGDMAITLGYYEANDGGGAEYKIINTQLNNEYQEELNNNLYATLIIKNAVNVKQFGTKSDGITNDYNSIMNAITYAKNINFENAKTYYISNRIILNNYRDLNIDGNNSILKFTGFSEDNVGNNGFIQLENCSDINIKNLGIDGNIEWIARPYTWESTHSIYSALRNKTYDGFRIYNSNNIIIDNCKATKIKVGYHFSFSLNCKLNNSQSSYTMADGVLIHGGCENIHVTNHFVYKGNDDQFSMVHETNDTNYVKRCSYRDCNAIDSFGACCVMQECIDCYATNCTSINNKDVPFKMGTSLGVFACSNCTIDSIRVESSNTIQGTNTSLSDAQLNGSMSIAYTSGKVLLENCWIKNCSFIETSGNNLSLYNPNHNGLKFKNCLFDGINIIFINVDDILFDNCIIKSHDGNTETKCAITFKDCSIIDDLTYSTRGHRALSCNNCHDIILDKVYLSGYDQTVSQTLSFYADDSSYKTAYIDVNETNIKIINMRDVYKTGVLELENINNYGYSTFKKGQLVYFNSNNSLYLITESNWTKIN